MKKRLENRIISLFAKKRKEGGKALIFFITAGFPDWQTNEEIIYTLDKNGCDILELGVPFSDPIADGLTIQRSSERALQQGVTLKKVLEFVVRLRQNTQIPIVLFSSLNPLSKFGVKELVRSAAAAGIDGLLCPDLPPEEAQELEALCQKENICLIYLIAPTTPSERKKLIAEHSSGFIYYISLKGVTGARDKLSSDITAQIREIKSLTEKPVAVGFGISRPEHTQLVASIGADAAVVGSALINLIEQYEQSPELLQKVKEFTTSLAFSLRKAGNKG